MKTQKNNKKKETKKDKEEYTVARGNIPAEESRSNEDDKRMTKQTSASRNVLLSCQRMSHKERQLSKRSASIARIHKICCAFSVKAKARELPLIFEWLLKREALFSFS